MVRKKSLFKSNRVCNKWSNATSSVFIINIRSFVTRGKLTKITKTHTCNYAVKLVLNNLFELHSREVLTKKNKGRQLIHDERFKLQLYLTPNTDSKSQL